MKTSTTRFLSLRRKQDGKILTIGPTPDKLALTASDSDGWTATFEFSSREAAIRAGLGPWVQRTGRSQYKVEIPLPYGTLTFRDGIWADPQIVEDLPTSNGDWTYAAYMQQLEAALDSLKMKGGVEIKGTTFPWVSLVFPTGYTFNICISPDVSQNRQNVFLAFRKAKEALKGSMIRMALKRHSAHSQHDRGDAMRTFLDEHLDQALERYGLDPTALYAWAFPTPVAEAFSSARGAFSSVRGGKPLRTVPHDRQRAPLPEGIQRYTAGKTVRVAYIPPGEAPTEDAVDGRSLLCVDENTVRSGVTIFENRATGPDSWESRILGVVQPDQAERVLRALSQYDEG